MSESRLSIQSLDEIRLLFNIQCAARVKPPSCQKLEISAAISKVPSTSHVICTRVICTHIPYIHIRIMYAYHVRFGAGRGDIAQGRGDMTQGRGDITQGRRDYGDRSKNS